MGINAALSSALSGLTAASRAAEIVSSNVANAMTEGYAAREIHLQARSLAGTGSGVAVAGVTRRVDPVITGDRRLAAAAAGQADLRLTFLQRIESAIGQPDSAGSLSGRIAALDATITEAAARPESEARLASILSAAQALTDAFGSISERIQSARAEADRRIAAEVGALNDALRGVDDLNSQIRRVTATGRDASALMDQRQQMIDRVAAIVPLREAPRDSGEVALFTLGGLSLLDGRPAVLGFDAAAVVLPEMQEGSGLSGLTLNGRSIRPDGPGLSGGTLATLFEVRDTLGPAAQAGIDGLARDLVQRFSDPALDSGLAPGQPGLFTDAGGPADPSHEVGLATRLRINAAVDPAQGGALWRLRAGVVAPVPGPTGDAALLNRMAAVLGHTRVPGSAALGSGARSLPALAADMLSLLSADRVATEAESGFRQARLAALREGEASMGVDTDQELQSLMLIEQSYAANAKVIQSVDEMIKALLGI